MAATPGQRRALALAAQDLQSKFVGVFGSETIEELLTDSFEQLASRATVTNWLVLGAERFARERLEALIQTADRSSKKLPVVLFLCIHNSGRSQMALGWFRHLAADRAIAWSGGSDAVSEMDSSVIATMAEVGIDISNELPKPWTSEFLEAADVIITMGCGDSCPLIPGTQYEDWVVDDPIGVPIAQVRSIRDEIGGRVRALLDRLEVLS